MRGHTIASTILALAAWIWFVYTAVDNHLIVALIQYTLYTLGILLAAVFIGKHVMLLFAWGLLVGLLFEIMGTRTGFPFGEYEYATGMGGMLGGVPWFIPYMWGLLSTIVYLATMPLVTRSMVYPLIAPLLLVVLDLSIDPLMVSLGLWRWAEGGVWFGVPLSNFVGWYIVGVAIYAPIAPLLRKSVLHSRGAWSRVLTAPYLSHLASYSLSMPLPGLAAVFLGIVILVVLLRVFDL